MSLPAPPTLMRIAFFATSYPTLSETFILDQVAGLVEKGHEVSVFARKPTQSDLGSTLPAATVHYVDADRRTAVRSLRVLLRERNRGAQVLRSLPDVWRASGLIEAVRLWSTASRLFEAGDKFDVAIAHFGPNALRAQRLRRMGVLSAPLAAVFHGRDLSHALAKRGYGIYAELLAHGDAMLPVSAYFARRLIDLGCDPSRIHVQHMGVDVTRFDLRLRTHTPSEPIRLLSVGRLVEKKGTEFAMRAFAALPRSGVALQWDIVGDGPERASLERLADTLGLRDRVRLLGALPRARVVELLGTHHVFLAASVTAKDGDEEGIPVAIMEAAASGLPIVSTRHSGIPELVRDGISGCLAEERDVPGLTAAIRSLIEAPQRWPSMGEAGRRIVETEFNLRVLNDRLNVHLERLVRGGEAAAAPCTAS